MSLTVEQKINLLILAGFEPAVNKRKNRAPRIVGGNEQGIPSLWRKPGGGWEFDPEGYTVRVPATWGEVEVDTIPDDLIYEAIGQTGEHE